MLRDDLKIKERGALAAGNGGDRLPTACHVCGGKGGVCHRLDPRVLEGGKKISAL